jgi:glycosyl transferase family 1
MGVIDAFRKAREQIDCRLVLVGNNASDDPEGSNILETIERVADEDIIVLAVDDPTLVNALQRSAAVVLQKSLREGFGLTVTEAMWKGAAIIGGDVGGIRRQTGWMERISGEHARSGGGKNGPAPEGTRAPEAGRLAGKGKRPTELSDEPAIRGLARPAVQVRPTGDLTVGFISMVKADANCPGSTSGRKRASQALRRH